MDALSYAAFTTSRDGGNVAGVVFDTHGASEGEMGSLAAALGHSETVFVESHDAERVHVRYFAPLSEVPFCGHATIALLVAAHDHGIVLANTLTCRAGSVDICVDHIDGATLASFVTVKATSAPASPSLVRATCELIGWEPTQLDPEAIAVVANAGAPHLLLFAANDERLEHCDYDLETGRQLMIDAGLTTIGLVGPCDNGRVTVRHLFARGGIREDPATGAGAAALAHALCERGTLDVGAWLEIDQGGYIGRPSALFARSRIDGRVEVRGSAVRLS